MGQFESHAKHFEQLHVPVSVKADQTATSGPCRRKSELCPRWNEKAGSRDAISSHIRTRSAKEPAMKKRSSCRQNPKPTAKAKRGQEFVTIGMDLGDRNSRYCLLSHEGEILREGRVATTKAGMIETFGYLGWVRIAIEVGTHSPWVTRLLQSLGHEVIVANPRQVKLITESSRKDDRLDAQGSPSASKCVELFCAKHCVFSFKGLHFSLLVSLSSHSAR